MIYFACDVVGVKKSRLRNIDGVDMWKALSENTPSPRTDMLYNIDDIDNYAAYRRGDYKYVIGTTANGKTDDWYGDTGLDSLNKYDETDVLKSQTAYVLAGFTTEQQIKEKLAKGGKSTTVTLHEIKIHSFVHFQSLEISRNSQTNC